MCHAGCHHFIIEYLNLTWATCDLFIQQGVHRAAEQLTGSYAALLRHPLHQLEDPLHVGSLTPYHLPEKHRHVIQYVTQRHYFTFWNVFLLYKQQLTSQYTLQPSSGFLDHTHLRCGWKLYVIGRKQKKKRKPHLKLSANVLPIWKLNIVCSLYLSLFIFVKWKLLNSATHSSLVYNTVQCYLHGGSSWLLSVVVVV